MSWTEERVELLTRLWADGHSASQIAKELGGVTRNAVIGKVHRLGLSNRVSNENTVAKPKAEAKPKPLKKPVKTETQKPSAKADSAAEAPLQQSQPALTQIVPAEQHRPPQPSANEISPEALASQREVEKKALRLSLMELTERTCKWPIGDPATDDFWFCGLPVEQGKPYCKPCNEVAFQPASARRARSR